MSTSPFASAHRLYVKSLYRRMLKNELDWIVRRDIWRAKAQEIRAEFERNRWAHRISQSRPCYYFSGTCNLSAWHNGRNVHDPRSLAIILRKAEVELANKLHPDPYIGIFNYFLLSVRRRLIIVRCHSRTYDARWHEMVSPSCMCKI